MNTSDMHENGARRRRGRSVFANRRGAMALIAVLVLFCAAPAIQAAYRNWTGSGPLATGMGDRVVTALAAGGKAVYAGTASGTVFRSDLISGAGVPAVNLLLLE